MIGYDTLIYKNCSLSLFAIKNELGPGMKANLNIVAKLKNNIIRSSPARCKTFLE